MARSIAGYSASGKRRLLFNGAFKSYRFCGGPGSFLLL